MSGRVPSVPEHVWPEAEDVDRFERRHGAVWCRRCGSPLTNRAGIRRGMKPCRVVRIALRDGP